MFLLESLTIEHSVETLSTISDTKYTTGSNRTKDSVICDNISLHDNDDSLYDSNKAI